MNPAGIPTEGERASYFNTAEGFIAYARRSLDLVR